MTFISVEATRTSGSVLTTMMAVLEVKEPTKAENVLLLMCMDRGWLWLRPHDSLNCLMMLEIFFEAVHVVVLLPAALGDLEECHALKQNHLHSIMLQQRVPAKTVFDAVMSARAGCRSGPTSSAAHVLAKCSSCLSSWSTLGMRECTI